MKMKISPTKGRERKTKLQDKSNYTYGRTSILFAITPGLSGIMHRNSFLRGMFAFVALVFVLLCRNWKLLDWICGTKVKVKGPGLGLARVLCREEYRQEEWDRERSRRGAGTKVVLVVVGTAVVVGLRGRRIIDDDHDIVDMGQIGDSR